VRPGPRGVGGGGGPRPPRGGGGRGPGMGYVESIYRSYKYTVCLTKFRT
jgi:hypothetical protein